jgi:hypothetical protein
MIESLGDALSFLLYKVCLRETKMFNPLVHVRESLRYESTNNSTAQTDLCRDALPLLPKLDLRTPIN